MDEILAKSEPINSNNHQSRLNTPSIVCSPQLSDEHSNENECKPDQSANDSSASLDIESQDFFTKCIIEQMSQQNIHLSKSIKSQGLTTEDMVFKLNDKSRIVEVIPMDKDGDCMFSSLTHQIHCYKIGSRQYTAAVANMRKDTVAHIRRNFTSFKFQMHGRLFQERDKNQFDLSDDMDADALDFLDSHLSKSGVWAGAESIKAVSEIHQVNILMFDEESKCWFPFDFKSEYERTVAIAYRLGQDKYYHYDTISCVGQHVLYECAVNLAKCEMSRRKLKSKEQMVIELTSP